MENRVGAVDEMLLARLRAAVDVSHIDANEHVASVLRLLGHVPGGMEPQLDLFDSVRREGDR